MELSFSPSSSLRHVVFCLVDLLAAELAERRLRFSSMFSIILGNSVFNNSQIVCLDSLDQFYNYIPDTVFFVYEDLTGFC